MSITAFAYYAYNYEVEVSTIQTAEYAVLVGIQKEGTESSLTSYTFSGSEGDEGVTFSLTAMGTETAVGYCEIVLEEQSYYTHLMEAGSYGMVVIKGNEGDTVRFVSHWGTFDVTEDAVVIGGEDYVIDVREPENTTKETKASEAAVSEPTEVSCEPLEESSEPTEESSEPTELSTEATEATEPTEEPSEEPEIEPSSEASEATTAE